MNLKKSHFQMHLFKIIYYLFLDIWLSYIEFKYSRSSNQTQNVSDIYWRAKRELSNDLVELFSQKLCLLKINLESADKDIYMNNE